MTQSTSDKAGLPAWFLIVAIGGIAGIVLGAVVFFGGGEKSEPAKTSAANATPTPAAAVTAAATPKPAVPAGTPLTTLPTTLDGWKKEISSANVDSYPALMDGVLRIGDPALRGQVAEQLLITWLNADRETYLSYLDQLEGGADEGKAAWPVLVPAFVKAVPQLGEAAVSSPELEEAVQWMTDYYAEQDARGALEWSKKWLLGEAQEAAFATIAGQLAKTSIPEAEALARSLQTPTSRVDAIANIGSQLGRQDPAKALAWAQGLKDADEKSAAVEEVMWSMAEANPEAAAEQVRQMNDPELLQNVGGTIAESLAAENPQRGVAWAEAVPAGPARDEAIVGALAGWAKQDPKAAYDYFVSKQAANAEAAEGLFEEWAVNDPAAASAQVRQIANAEVREQALTGVVNGWLNSGESESVEQWIDQLPTGRERDVASATLVDALGATEPQAAWERAVTITDAQVRQDALLSAFSSLVQVDLSNARAVLNGPGISAEDKKLLQPVFDSIAQLNELGNAPAN